jgi:hypothetical protein
VVYPTHTAVEMPSELITYFLVALGPERLARASHGDRFPSAAGMGGVVGVQLHLLLLSGYASQAPCSALLFSRAATTSDGPGSRGPHRSELVSCHRRPRPMRDQTEKLQH